MKNFNCKYFIKRTRDEIVSQVPNCKLFSKDDFLKLNPKMLTERGWCMEARGNDKLATLCDCYKENYINPNRKFIVPENHIKEIERVRKNLCIKYNDFEYSDMDQLLNAFVKKRL